MEDNLTEKIRALLADPQAVERIAAIAGSLGASPGGGAPEPSEAPPVPSQPAFAPQSLPKDPRLELLRALHPLVAEEKRGRLEDLLRIATVASLLGNFKR